jgi:hypothetical protein
MIRAMLVLILRIHCEGPRGQSIPPLEGQSFGRNQVNLPGDLKGKIGIFILGFDKKSSEQTKGWGDNILHDYGKDPSVLYYQMPVLADVPGLIHGMVTQGIKRQQSETERIHFIPILDAVAAWKQAATFSAVDDVYLIVVDSEGQIVWRSHGVATAEFGGTRTGVGWKTSSKEIEIQS